MKVADIDIRQVTLEFVHSVTTALKLMTVFCGHVHFTHADSINARAVQYVDSPGFAGGVIWSSSGYDDRGFPNCSDPRRLRPRHHVEGEKP